MSLLRRGFVVGLAALAGLEMASASLLSILSDSSDSSNSSISASAAPQVCNNSPELCDRLYSNMTHMGAHDCAFIRDDSTHNSLAGNQYLNATRALDAGIRLLQTQVHQDSGQLFLCHTNCILFNAGLLVDWLTKINDWVVRHPNDVVTILLVNSDNADVLDFATALESSGLASFGFMPTQFGVWPTLGAMISQGKRLVVLVTNIVASTAAPYILPEFNYVFETPFTVTDIGAFNCTIDRPGGIGDDANSVQGKLHLPFVNHFKDLSIVSDIVVPDTFTIDTVNSASTTTEGSLGTHLTQCRAIWLRQPVFALVDFWSVGDVMGAADFMNGIKTVSGRVFDNDTNQSSAAAGMTTMRSWEQGVLIVFFAMALVMM